MKKYIYLIILLLIAALNFNLFIKPYNLVCGGTQGLAVLIYKIFPISYSLIILFLNLIFLVLSIIFLSKEVSISIIISSFVYPIFIFLTKNFFFVKINIIINIIIIGIISGITNGLIYKLGLSIGGIQLLPKIINKYFKISYGLSHFIINFILLYFNMIIYGLSSFIYSLVIIILNSLIINYLN